jgi:threonine/homoserine/homoserine lactone efflux protein
MSPLLPEAPWIQITLFALSSSFSPGPNNLLIAATGAAFGTRRSLPTLLGMYAGCVVVFAAAAFGAARVFALLPGLLGLLQVAGATYLVVLAVGLLRASWKLEPADAPVGFLQAALLQFVNPKLWLMAVATISLCTLPGPGGHAVSTPLVVFFVLMTVPAMLAYLKFGTLLGALSASPRGRRLANATLAVLTAASALLLLAPVAVDASIAPAHVDIESARAGRCGTAC